MKAYVTKQPCKKRNISFYGDCVLRLRDCLLLANKMSTSQPVLTLAIRHGGTFQDSPLQYIGGKLEYLYDYAVSRINLKDLIDTLQSVCGYKDLGTIYYKLHDRNFEDGLRKILTEKDVKDMVDYFEDDIWPIELFIVNVDERYVELDEPCQAMSVGQSVNTRIENSMNLDNVNEEPTNKDGAEYSDGDSDDDKDTPIFNSMDNPNAIFEVFQCSDGEDDNMSVASLEHLSEGEDEVREVRLKKIEKVSKKKAQLDLEEITENVNNSNEPTVMEPTHIGQAPPQAPPEAPSQASQSNVRQQVKKGKQPKRTRMNDQQPAQAVPPAQHHHDPFLTTLCPDYDPNGFVENVVESDNEDPFKDDEESDLVGDRWPVHNPNTKWKLMRPYYGEKYTGPGQLKQCIITYAVANGYQLYYERNEKKRLLVNCGVNPKSKKNKNKSVNSEKDQSDKGKNKSMVNEKEHVEQNKNKSLQVETDETNEEEEEKVKCPWRLYASWMQNEKSFQVKSLHDEHTCGHNYDIGLISSRWIANRYGHDIKKNPSWKAVDMVAAILHKYKVKVSMGQCYRARQKALEEVEEALIQHYGKLWDYSAELLRANRGSTVEIQVDRPLPTDPPYFKRMYVCFTALREGFLAGCRRFIGLDGCFLKTMCKGELLAAVGKDGNNHIFPIAWATVEVENTDSWSWFIEHLKNDLSIGTGAGWTIMSDQMKGIVTSMKNLLPEAEHRQCARHIYANFRKKYTGVQMRAWFWQAAKSTTVEEFNSVMDEIKTEDAGAYKYLMENEQRSPTTWSRAFFQEYSKCDNVENNIAECFNAFILLARKKPIITMNEELRVSIMERMAKLRANFQQCKGRLCPTIKKKFEKARDEFRFWDVHHNGLKQFEVRRGLDGYTVDLNAKTCTCRAWQLSGIPCCHGVGAIVSINEDPEKYLSEYYTVSYTKKAYFNVLSPLNGVKLWPKTTYDTVLPPITRRMPGRPRNMRRKEQGPRIVKNPNEIDRVGRVMTCTNCLQPGHNKKTCKNETILPPPKVPGKPGRPRVNPVATAGENSGRGGGRGKGSHRVGGNGSGRGMGRGHGNNIGRKRKQSLGVGMSIDSQTGIQMIGNAQGEPVPVHPVYVQEWVNQQRRQVHEAPSNQPEEVIEQPQEDQHVVIAQSQMTASQRTQASETIMNSSPTSYIPIDPSTPGGNIETALNGDEFLPQPRPTGGARSRDQKRTFTKGGIYL